MRNHEICDTLFADNSIPDNLTQGNHYQLGLMVCKWARQAWGWWNLQDIGGIWLIWAIHGEICIMCHPRKEPSRWFPARHAATPSHHPFLSGIFHEINQPAIWGSPHDELETPNQLRTKVLVGNAWKIMELRGIFRSWSLEGTPKIFLEIISCTSEIKHVQNAVGHRFNRSEYHLNFIGRCRRGAMMSIWRIVLTMPCNNPHPLNWRMFKFTTICGNRDTEGFEHVFVTVCLFFGSGEL